MFHTPAHKQPAAAQAPFAPGMPHCAAETDFVLADHSSILVLTPMSQEAKDWVSDNLPPDAQRWGRGVAIEPRYWPNIQDGILGAGLSVE
jgi:hypothetical protein